MMIIMTKNIMDLNGDLMAHLLSFLNIDSFGGAIALSATCRSLRSAVLRFKDFDEFACDNKDRDYWLWYSRRQGSFPGQRSRWFTVKDAAASRRERSREADDINRLGLFRISSLDQFNRVLARVEAWWTDIVTLDLSCIGSAAFDAEGELDVRDQLSQLVKLRDLRLDQARLSLSNIPPYISKLTIHNYNVKMDDLPFVLPPSLKYLTLRVPAGSVMMVHLRFPSIHSTLVRVDADFGTARVIASPPVRLTPDAPFQLQALVLSAVDIDLLRTLQLGQFTKLRELSIKHFAPDTPKDFLAKLSRFRHLTVLTLAINVLEDSSAFLRLNSLVRLTVFAQSVRYSETFRTALGHIARIPNLKHLRIVRGNLVKHEELDPLFTLPPHVQLVLDLIGSKNPIRAMLDVSGQGGPSVLPGLCSLRGSVDSVSLQDFRRYPSLEHLSLTVSELNPKMLRLPPTTRTLSICLSMTMPISKVAEACEEILTQWPGLDCFVLTVPGSRLLHDLLKHTPPPGLVDKWEVSEVPVERDMHVPALFLKTIPIRPLVCRLPPTMHETIRSQVPHLSEWGKRPPSVSRRYVLGHVHQ